MSRKSRRGRHETQGFVCIQCRCEVPAPGAVGWGGGIGTKHRNHCPLCLWSRHVDDEVGDRGAACRGKMRPIAIEVRNDGEWAIVHRCEGCGVLRTNRIAGDDAERALLGLALRPMARPAFPLDLL